MTLTLIKHGTLVTASDMFKADILIQDEKIIRVGLDLEADSAQVIDATHKLILPGGVDPHVHLDLPMFGTVSSDDHYTGHKAAAFGGTTTVMDFVVLEQQGFQHSVDVWMKMAEKAAIDYSFHMNLTRFDEQIAREIPSLMKMGIQTLKVFTAYNGRLRLDDGGIFKALQVARDNGMLVM
jgi:dihydropyrimidinase